MVKEEIRGKVGRVFVSLTSQLYGGEITRNGENDPGIGNPDIINWERNQAYESKASISSDHHKINPGQIQHYRELVDSEFPLTNPEVYYFFWQHKKRGISEFKENELEKILITNINRLLIVSFDIIEAGAQIWDTTGKNCSWGEVYMFRSSERRALTLNTNQELQKMKLNPDDYKIFNETISSDTYKYKWWHLPEFNIKTILRKGMRGLERS